MDDLFWWIGILIPVGVGVLAIRQYNLTRACFALSAALLAIRAFFWVFLSLKYAPWKLGVVYLAVLALIGASLYAINLWIEHSRKEIESERHTTSAALPATTPSPPTPPGAKPDDQGRIFSDDDPDYLTSFFRDELLVHAQRRTVDYLGKWKRVSGFVSDISENLDKSTEVKLAADEQKEVRAYFLYFDAHWHDRVMLLRRDQRVTIVGSIGRIMDRFIFFEKCELE